MSCPYPFWCYPPNLPVVFLEANTAVHTNGYRLHTPDCIYYTFPPDVEAEEEMYLAHDTVVRTSGFMMKVVFD